MSPLTEQLVRDYLNRLSVAARHELNFSDRQVLLDQIRAKVEAESGGVRRASPARVRMILAGFGDPIAVVESARVRIAAGESVILPGDGVAGSHEPAASAVVPPDESDMSCGRDAGSAVGDAASLADTARVTPVVGRVNGARADSFERAMSANDRAQRGDLLVVSDRSAAMGAGVPRPALAPESAPPDRPGTAAEPATGVPDADAAQVSGFGSVPGPARGAPEMPGSAEPEPPSETRQAVSGPRSLLARVRLPPQRIWSMPTDREDGGRPAPALAAPTGDAGADPGDKPGDGGPPAESSPADPASSVPRSWWPRPVRPPEPPGNRPARPWARVLARVLELALRHKLESVALVLLGVGGAIFPPVWLLGAVLALPSRQWDPRDKWTGLMLPVLLLVIGTVAVVVFGGAHSSPGLYVREAWQGAVLLSRVLALLSAGYLLLRLHRGRRTPKQPPWNVPHRLG